MATPDEIRHVFERWLNNMASENDLTALDAILAEHGNHELMELLRPLADTTPADERFAGQDWETMLNDILRTKTLRRRWSVPLWRAAAAAVLIGVIGTGAYLYFTPPTNKQVPTTVNHPPVQNDVAPGGSKAMLTLADGSTILLDSAANGQLAMQGGASVKKLSDGQIVYDINERPDGTASVPFNTMTTPKGGQYQLGLPDGSRVWLNAASSITYPVVFTGKERKVKITGEAYFDIAANAAQPFIVDIDGRSAIAVLGTSFNVNAYPEDESIKTTLLSGRVRVEANNKIIQLSSGQQAVLDKNNLRLSPAVDVQQVMAWKNGIFNFDNKTLYGIMRELSRWYDVEPIYEPGITDIRFKGKIYRDLTLRQVLQLLEGPKVHFTITENQQLIISP